jgi:L-alanine-DL-glutamate epimerase-like enolase superfamily enzyme
MKLTWTRQTLKLKYRFATAQASIDEKDTLVVALEHGGVTGLGEVCPSRLYGHSIESSEAALHQIRESLGDDPFLIEPILARLIPPHDTQRATIAAVDSALHDWVGKALGVPVWRLLGLPPPRVRTTFTIGIASPEETGVKVEEALASGYTALKVKVGVDTDHQTLTLIRKHFHGPLLLDANEAWSPAEAPAKVLGLAEFKPAMVEQPLPKSEWRHLKPLRELGVAPIFADESCERPADVVKLDGFVDGVNVKFTKCGGIREALRMVTLARGLGMQLMLGCFVSSSLAIAPALTIAGLFDFVDLDGHLLLAADPFTGIGQDGSLIELGAAAGLGVHSAAAEAEVAQA